MALNIFPVLFLLLHFMTPQKEALRIGVIALGSRRDRSHKKEGHSSPSPILGISETLMRRLSHRGKWGRSKSGADVHSEQESCFQGGDMLPVEHARGLLAIVVDDMPRGQGLEKWIFNCLVFPSCLTEQNHHSSKRLNQFQTLISDR